MSRELDEDLQSRQLAVYGRESMLKLSSARVFISGLNGLGVEIAKNVVLANVGSVVLHDATAVKMKDLGSQFFLTEDDIGKSRAVVTAPRLRELNPAVDVSVLDKTDLDPTRDFTDVDVAVFVQSPMGTVLRFDEMCRNNNIAFIRTEVHGLFGNLFVDFGDEFEVSDTTGEDPKSGVIASIIKESPVIVHFVDEEDRPGFDEGDFVTFSEVQGLEDLNGKTFRIVEARPYIIRIECDLSQINGEYIRGGILTEVKQPKTLKFSSLDECISSPEDPSCGRVFMDSDLSKFGRSQVLHKGFVALSEFQVLHGNLPTDSDVASLFDLIPGGVEDDGEKKIIESLIRSAGTCLNPMAAIFGGLVGQEVIKACTGKFTPFFQWLHFDCLECLPDDASFTAYEDIPPELERYTDQVRVLGIPLQEKLGALKLFMVGAGALGCEFLKNFALMGICCGKEGKLYVTDDDTIEKSNLSRQFLFRNYMIGQSKSDAGAQTVRNMNSSFNVISMQDRVCPETERIFNDPFWESLDVICNALDNIKARLYVDQRCVFYGKPLLESGTLGPKCNTQIIIPHLTENYGASTDPPERVAPDCTLHNFPHNINHCISWARSDFIGGFESLPSDASRFLKYVEESNGDMETALAKFVGELEKARSSPHDIVEKLVFIKDSMFDNRATTFEDCVHWARLRFEEIFHNSILQLTGVFPEESKTKSGAFFWSPPKRYPHALEFDSDNDLHIQFIMSAANLRMKLFALAVDDVRDVERVKEVVKDVMVADFTPRKDVHIQVDEEDQADGMMDDEIIRDLCDSIIESSKKYGLDNLRFASQEFEKDDDTNFHMDFIGAVANLRARNYDIPEVDKLQAKLIAGRIVPAIATSTAIAAGLVCLEMLKVVADRPVEAIRNTFVNIALPLITMSEPFPAAKVVSRIFRNIPDPINHPEYEEEEEIVAYPEGHTAWDRIMTAFSLDCTLEEFIQYFENNHNLILSSLVIASRSGKTPIVYQKYLPNTHKRLKMTMREIYTQYAEIDLDDPNLHYVSPVVMLTTKEGDSVETPTVVHCVTDHYKF